MVEPYRPKDSDQHFFSVLGTITSKFGVDDVPEEPVRNISTLRGTTRFPRCFLGVPWQVLATDERLCLSPGIRDLPFPQEPADVVHAVARFTGSPAQAQQLVTGACERG